MVSAYILPKPTNSLVYPFQYFVNQQKHKVSVTMKYITKKVCVAVVINSLLCNVNWLGTCYIILYHRPLACTQKVCVVY